MISTSNDLIYSMLKFLNLSHVIKERNMDFCWFLVYIIHLNYHLLSISYQCVIDKTLQERIGRVHDSDLNINGSKS